MKKKGFATSAILYTMLLLFLVLMTSILNNLQNKKIILDQLKVETINALNQDTIIDSLLNQIGDLNQHIVSLETEIQTLKQEMNSLKDINGTYTTTLAFGNLQANVYTFSETLLIGDVREKNIKISSSCVEGVYRMTDSEIEILTRRISKNRRGFFINLFDRNDADMVALAKKLAGYTITFTFTVSDI